MIRNNHFIHVHCSFQRKRGTPIPAFPLYRLCKYDVVVSYFTAEAMAFTSEFEIACSPPTT